MGKIFRFTLLSLLFFTLTLSGAILIWLNWSAWYPERKLQAPEPIYSAYFTTDGGIIASSRDGLASWVFDDLESTNAVRITMNDTGPNYLIPLVDRERIVSEEPGPLDGQVGTKILKVYARNTAKLLKTISLPSVVQGSSGRLLAIPGSDRAVFFIRESASHSVPEHRHPIMLPSRLYIVDLSTGKYNELDRDKLFLGEVALSHNGRYLLYCDGWSTNLYDTQTLESIRSLRAEEYLSQHYCCFSPDDSCIATSTVPPNSHVCIFDRATGNLNIQIKPSEEMVTEQWFFSDGKRILISTYDGSCTVWDCHSSEYLATYSGHLGKRVTIYTCRISPDQKRVLTSSEETRIWDPENGHELFAFPMSTAGINSVHGNNFYFFDVNKDLDRILAKHRDGTVWIWKRRYPEWWWGQFCRPEVWFTIICVIGWIYALTRRVTLRFRYRRR